MKDIVITGVGIVSAIGNNTSSVLESLKNETSGIGKIKHLASIHKELPVGEVKLSNEEMMEILKLERKNHSPISRTTLMGAVALRQALKDANISCLGNKRIAFINGTTVGGMDITEQYFSRMKTDDACLEILDKHDCGSCSEEIAALCGIDAEICTVSTACSSALNAVILGAEMLQNDETDIVIAGGSEALSKFHLNGFNSLMILDHERCRPFDETRAGINLGEGAAYVVLQRKEDTEGPIRAYVSGYSNACDAFHQTATSDEGYGPFLAMSQALKMSKLSTEDIDYINAHGTGTPNNDLTESVAIKKLFGTSIPYISSTKAYTGHTTSASGAIELVICLLAMEHDFIPSNLGCTRPLVDGIVPQMGGTSCRVDNVMCNAFGFGGNDSSLIISRNSCGNNLSTDSNIDVTVVAENVIDNIEQLKDSKDMIPPMEARRMGKLLKAATMTSLRALKDAGIEKPDAIITATSLGMIDNSEKFLNDLVENNETLLKPTLFMQSTHNTIGSSLAIRLGCHGYNITYAQGKDSLEWAKRDAVRLIKTGKANSVLVGLHDESTPLLNDFYLRAKKQPLPMIYSRSILYMRS
ncbi:MAG: beta-ketoacyl-[acyl-carrier-protein] synthase family protein [Treponema sp.]|nr:beta-ketoacyl-[acyl-carrier-protein] synthase family protein [Treponema sp.]